MLQPFQAGHTTFQKGHAHEVGVVRTDLVKAGGEERIAALVVYHRAAVTHQGVAAGRHIFHIGQGAEEVFSSLAFLGCCERNIARCHALRAEPHVFVGHIIILYRHHPHHPADESHPGKLHEEQRPLPLLLALGIAAEHLRDGYPCKQLPRQHAAYQEEQQYRPDRHPKAVARKEIGQPCGSRVLHKVLKGKEQEYHNHQGQTDDESRLCQKHPEDTCAAGPAALLHAHGLGPPRQGGDGDERIVQRGDEEDGKAHHREDDRRTLHVLISPVRVAQRGNLRGIAIHLLVFRRTVFIHHRPQATVQRLGIRTRLQTDVLEIRISPTPRIIAHLSRPRRRQGDNALGLQRRVVRQVGIRAPHRQVTLVVIADDLAYGVFRAKHLPCQRLA